MRRYERELYGYLRRYVGNAEMAEDVFQATFLQIHLKCEQFDEGRRFRPCFIRLPQTRQLMLSGATNAIGWQV